MWLNGTWTTSNFVGNLPPPWTRQHFYPNATREYIYNNTQGGVMQYKSHVQLNTTIV